MKKGFLLFLILFSPSLILLGQSCEIYFPIVENTGFEMLTFSGKDKPSGKLKYEVISVSQAGNTKTAIVKSEYFDKKGEEQYSADYEVRCDGENVYVDMSSYFNQQLSVYKNMEVTMESEDYVLPSDLKVGEELRDAQVVARMNKDGNRFGSMTLKSQNKKVISMEKVTVPAGTFDCYKIEGRMISETETMGIPIKFEFQNIEWYAKGIGLVRTESYGKNGKLIGYTVLNSRF